MKPCNCMFLMLLWALGASAGIYTLPDGTVVTGKVKGVESGVKIVETEDGIVRVPTKAVVEHKDFSDEEAARRKKHARRAAAIRATRATGLSARLTILQMVEDGILAKGVYYTETEYEKVEEKTVGSSRISISHGMRTRRQAHSLGERIFVEGSFGSVVDGDTVQCVIYPNGRYSYTTVLGGQATVRKYTTYLERAVDPFALPE